jgi:hypothetical protein
VCSLRLNTIPTPHPAATSDTQTLKPRRLSMSCHGSARTHAGDDAPRNTKQRWVQRRSLGWEIPKPGALWVAFIRRLCDVDWKSCGNFPSRSARRVQCCQFLRFATKGETLGTTCYRALYHATCRLKLACPPPAG